MKISKLIRSDDYETSGHLKETIALIIDQNLTDLLPKIGAQTLVIWGSNDDAVSVDTTQTYKKLVPNCKVRIVWGAKHDPHLEKPEKFMEILEECL